LVETKRFCQKVKETTKRVNTTTERHNVTTSYLLESNVCTIGENKVDARLVSHDVGTPS